MRGAAVLQLGEKVWEADGVFGEVGEERERLVEPRVQEREGGSK